MSNSIGRINLDLGVNTSGFKKELNGIGKMGNNLSSVFGKLGGVIAAAFSVKTIASFAKSCINLGSDLAEVQNVVDVTFGSMSEAVNDWAENAMTSYGLSEKVAKEYMGQFGAMSKAFGNTEQMAYDQAAALTGLAGDVASFYNMTTEEAFTKLKSVYTGETEALKSLGVVMTQSALDSYALANGYGKTTDAMSEQEKVALRLAFVQDKLAGASGDFARTSDGWANQVRVLSLRFDALKASIGQGLIAALTPVIRALNQLMVYLQAAADAFSNFMQVIFGVSGGSSALSSVGADLAAGVGSASASSGDLADNAASAAGSAAKMKKALAGFDNLNILSNPNSGGGGGGGASSGVGSNIETPDFTNTNSAIDIAKQKLDELKTKLLEIANITGLSGLWDDFQTSVDNVKIGLENLWSSLQQAIDENKPALDGLKTSWVNTFLTITNTISTIVGDMFTSISEGFRSFTEENSVDIEEFFGNVIAIFTETATLISDVAGDLFADLQSWWETKGKPVFDGIVKAIGDVWKWVLDIYNIIIAPVIKKVIEVLRKLWDGTLRPLWNNILGLVSDIWECILAFWNNILKPVVDWIIKKFGPPISAAFQSIVTNIGNAIATIGGILNGLITAFRGVIQFITGVFSGDWKKAWNGIKTIFTGIWQAIRSAISPIINGILGAVESFINGIISGLNWLIRQINKISFKVPDWVPGIGGKQLGFHVAQVSGVSLPRLATGGYVAANTPQLAIIGDNKREGEIVAPESKIAEAVAAGFAMVMSKMQQLSTGSNERPIYLTLKLGEDTFWEGFINYHNSIVKRTGDSPLLV